MAYINFQNCTREEYEQIIYSQNAQNKIKIIFNGNELIDAGRYCEKATMSSRILPNDNSKRFSLDNFVAKELTLVLHDINLSVIKDPINVLIGTLVDNEQEVYEYVSLGLFNIQDKPVTDKDKITLTLRDNRVKFDFPYDAKPLIDASGGSATKKQILNDICTKAGVICDTTTFLGEDDAVGIYDSSINATIYVSYIAEQAGMIPTITREGHLKFINVNNSTTWKIPLNLVEKYELGKSFQIQRIVYESGIIKYETSSDKTLDTLYIDSANPYIKDQQQINTIYSNLSGFTIDSLKTGKILGNPAIDPYDIIEIYGYYETLPNGNKRFVSDENTVVARTLANFDFTYRKSMVAEYNTIIGEEERKENVTINSEASNKKYLRTEYDELNGSINLIAGQVEGQNSKIAQMQISVDEINRKIGEVTDITVTAEDTDAQVELDSVNESEPIQIKIHPIINNISYLYPHNGLFPSSNLFLKRRTLRFIRSYTEEGEQKTQIIDYELPYDLLYYDQDTYDEFYLDYDSHTCHVIKRCVYSFDGTVTPLENEQVIDIDPYPEIMLGDGDYTVTLLGYNQAYLFVRLMASNIYTTQFATKVELSTQIKSTAKSISLTANNGYASSGIVIRLYNEDGTVLSETDANITMTGMVKFTDLSGSGTTEINGDNITTGIIKSNNYIAETSGTAINLNNGTIDTKNFKLSATGNITATGGTIGGWTINNNSLHTADNNYYLGTTGITATIGETSIDNIIFKAGNKFGVSSGGTLYAQNAILNGATVSGTINATSGTFNGTIYSSSGTIGGFTIGNYSLYGSTNRGEMNIQRGNSASVDFPANGGRLMLGSTANNGVALTTASHLVISDSYGHTDTGSSAATIGIRAIYGDARIATNYDFVVAPNGRFYVNNHYGLTGQSGFKDSNNTDIYLAFWKGILVGAGRSAFSTSTYPWLA